MINFSQLGANIYEKRIDPRDIFMGLIKPSTKYQYPRDVQGEVWKQWYARRNDKDVIIKMNTGSGKTIVALLILQSCLNEGIGPALYVVPDNYLIKQVVEQADELGIKVITSEENLDYQRGKAILVISIQKLINGKSVFGLRERDNYPIGSVIVDDMHACIGTIQEQFSISIPKTDELFKKFINIFYNAMNQQAAGRFYDIVEDNGVSDNMLVPFWEWQEKCQAVYELLSENIDNDHILFKWNLIKDCLRLSHCYISNKCVSIIPHCTPIHKIRSFENAKRRIYMSATLPDDSPFLTVMGIDFKENMTVITPEKANDIGERLIIVPKTIKHDLTEEEVRDAISQKAREYNVIVIVPSFALARIWERKGGRVFSAENISQGIENIKNGKAGLYIIVNRYDGIDLPDDACRILVIDGLPNISNMNDEYEEDVVGKSERIQREQIQRIEQGMGRGVRSNNDYCLIFLLGNQLTKVLYTDSGYKYFSNATKKQFELSDKLCGQIEGESLDVIIGTGDHLLKRNREWIEACKNATANVQYIRNVNVSNASRKLRQAFNYGLHGETEQAAKELNTLVNEETNLKMKGFYKQLMAEYINFSDKSEAQQIMKSAKIDNMEVLNPIEGIRFNKETEKKQNQSINIMTFVEKSNQDQNGVILLADDILDDLCFKENSSKRFEDAVCNVFKMIGYYARQPEREIGKGPDDYVALGDNQYWVIECKNETTTDTINKHDCNQLNGSYNWFINEHQGESYNCTPIMIHNSCVFNYECSPNLATRIMTPECLEKFKHNVQEFIKAYCKNDNFASLEKTNELIQRYKLNKEVLLNEYTVKFLIKK